MDEAQGALTQLRAYLAQQDLHANTQLPPEREFCEVLGVSRGELRKALAVLEENGELWRHVGKGTFVGTRPFEEITGVAEIAAASNPREVMHARLVIEPVLAREAALNATAADIAEMRQCLKASREATTWRQYENCDNRLHRLVAEASHNSLLIALFDTLNEIEQLLSERRYLAGDTITEADWRLFTTLIRFDAVYYGHFKCNWRHIWEYPNLSNYLRELYQWPGVADTVNMDHIKRHYYISMRNINPSGIVPLGPALDFEAKHDRGRFG